MGGEYCRVSYPATIVRGRFDAPTHTDRRPDFTWGEHEGRGVDSRPDPKAPPLWTELPTPVGRRPLEGDGMLHSSLETEIRCRRKPSDIAYATLGSYGRNAVQVSEERTVMKSSERLAIPGGTLADGLLGEG